MLQFKPENLDLQGSPDPPRERCLCIQVQRHQISLPLTLDPHSYYANKVKRPTKDAIATALHYPLNYREHSINYVRLFLC